MRQEIKLQSLLKPQNGVISLCCYCGEQVRNAQKLCSTCRTKKGREGILEQNIEILKNLRAVGYCLGKVDLPVA